MVTVRYLVVAGAYCWLLVVTARYRSLLLIHTFSINEKTLMNGLMDTEGSLKSQSQKKLVSILLYGSDTSDRKTKRKALIACVTL